LSKSEIKGLACEFETFREAFEFDYRKARVEVVENDDEQLLLLDEKPILFRSEGRLVPTLFFERYIESAPRIVVDRGAIPHVCNGADVMAPGVRKVEGTFSKGAFVVVIDETYRKPLAVGEALVDSEMMRDVRRGPVVETLHYAGDIIYRIGRPLCKP
jgi:PUA-domain protein